ncbi:Cytochrome b561/ferric reductase transmembrane protein family [Abeliophyllum distichum]|uniref:Cytochrome b561/ferric reductase transmembrane protein family n=1 Tax=Abeliophyllum distichum TaxID=126358 RepID=A0ABD1SXY2_9LAMI
MVVVDSLGWTTESSIMPRKHHQYSHHLEVHRAKKKISAHNPFSQKNSSVGARASKDKIGLKAVNDGSTSYAALERKVELYNKRVRGELFDEEDSEKYCVDFFFGDYDDTLPNMKATGLGQATAKVDRSEHKRFVMEVHEKVNQARENVSQLKIRKQEQIAARREKLKQAYLRKQLENLKGSKIEQT